MQRSDEPVVAKARTGKGLFAARAYRVGQQIMKITGRIVSADEVWDVGGVTSDNAFRFGPETYLDPVDGPGRYLNHSCRPNAAVVKRSNQLFLMAASRIARSAEITVDYSTILGNDDIWTMRCRCRQPGCRRLIARVGSLPDRIRDDYEERGMIPRYILKAPDLFADEG